MQDKDNNIQTFLTTKNRFDKGRTIILW